MNKALIKVGGGGANVPVLFAPSPRAGERFIEFFTAHIRNPNTRRAYFRAVADFAAWCETNGLPNLQAIGPVHVATYIEGLRDTLAVPSIKLQLAAIRMLFDWLVVGQVVPFNPASSVRAPKHSVKKGKTPVLTAEEARALLNGMDTATIQGLRDRALVGLMTYTFARVGAAVAMRVEDVYVQGRRTWVRLHEKGGKLHEMPCHHNLEEYLQAYVADARLLEDKAWLFQSVQGRTGQLTGKPLLQSNVHAMIQRRADAVGIRTKVGCHSFRATGITEYLRNGGKLEIAQHMANHESARTTGLYDRRNDDVTLDEVERILI